MFVSLNDRKRLGLPLAGPPAMPTSEVLQARTERAREMRRLNDKRRGERRARERAEATGREYVPMAERQRRAAEKRAAKASRPLKVAQPWHGSHLTASEKRALRKKLDPVYALRIRIQDTIRRGTPAWKARKNIQSRLRRAIVKGKSSRKLEERLGYTIPALVRHLRLQFTDGMTWEKFVAGEIHIDHIRPLRLFDCTTPEGLRAAWALTNLQPLWAADNQAKSGKVLTLL